MKQWSADNQISDWSRRTPQETDLLIRLIFKALHAGEITPEQAEEITKGLGVALASDSGGGQLSAPTALQAGDKLLPNIGYCYGGRPNHLAAARCITPSAYLNPSRRVQ